MFSPNTIELDRSWQIILLLTVLFLAILLALSRLAMPEGLQALTFGVLTCHWIYVTGHHGLRVWPHSLRKMTVSFDQHGELICRTTDNQGHERRVTIDGDSLVVNRFSILSLNPNEGFPWRRQLAILTSDNCDRETFRRLRVLLRFGNQAQIS